MSKARYPDVLANPDGDPRVYQQQYEDWRREEDERTEDEAEMRRPCDTCGEPNPCRCIEALPGRCDVAAYKADADARGER